MAKQHLYLLPGTMCDHRIWAGMAKELERLAPNNYQLHYLTIPALYSINDIVIDIKNQIDKCLNKKDVQPIGLIGFSLGGYLATAFTLRFPEQVDRLMLVSNMSAKLPENELKERKRTISWLKAHGYNGIPVKRINALLDVDARKNQSIIEIIKIMDEDLGQEVLIQQLQVTTERENLLPEIIKHSVPTHFCIGESDCFVDINRLSTLCSASENTELSIISNTGHMLPLEQPEVLSRQLRSFFNLNEADN